MNDETTTEEPNTSVEPGQVVYLASGGPPMTVRDEHEGSIFCDWFEGTTLMQRGFPRRSLVKELRNEEKAAREVDDAD